MKKSSRKYSPKASPRPLLHARNSLKNEIFRRRIIKKLTSFFHSNPVRFNGQDFEKQKGPGTSDQSLFKLQDKLRKITLLMKQFLL